LVLTFTKKTRSDLLRKLRKLNLSFFLRKKMESRIKNFHALANDMLSWKNINSDSDQLKFTREFIVRNKLQEDEANFKKEVARVR
jgi:hypothetical protein